MKSLLLVVLAACGSKPAPTPVDPKPASASPADNMALCVQGMQRARTCTDQYIPALVDVRAQKDHPAGVAAEVAKDRDGVIAKAKAEWAKDSTDDAITAQCQRLTGPDGKLPQTAIDQAKGCLAQADCSGYVACIIPIVTTNM